MTLIPHEVGFMQVSDHIHAEDVEKKLKKKEVKELKKLAEKPEMVHS